MSNKEAQEWLKAIEEKYVHGGDEEYDKIRKEAISMAIKALEQEPKTDTLDKIRAEIERERSFQRAIDEYDIATGLRKALEIIDKYKSESEEGYHGEDKRRRS